MELKFFENFIIKKIEQYHVYTHLNTQLGIHDMYHMIMFYFIFNSKLFN